MLGYANIYVIRDASIFLNILRNDIRKQGVLESPFFRFVICWFLRLKTQKNQRYLRRFSFFYRFFKLFLEPENVSCEKDADEV